VTGELANVQVPIAINITAKSAPSDQIPEEIECVKYYWEIIADNLKRRGWSLGWLSAVDSQGRTI
jgi:hypothetical protein